MSEKHGSGGSGPFATAVQETFGVLLEGPIKGVEETLEESSKILTPSGGKSSAGGVAKTESHGH